MTRLLSSLRRPALALWGALLVCAVLAGSETHGAVKKKNPSSFASQEASQPVNATEYSGSGLLALGSEQAPQNCVEGQIYALTLPAEVQLDTLRPDWTDIGVFNAAGKLVPFSLRQKKAEQVKQLAQVEHFYEIWAKKHAASSEEMVLAFTIDADAKLSPKIIDTSKDTLPDLVLKGYVIPAPVVDVPIDTMTFSWVKGKEPTVTFSISTSDDLLNWKTLVSTASLLQLTGKDGTVLESSTVKLNGSKLDKFVRFLFDDGYAPASFSRVEMVQWSSERRYLDYTNIHGKSVQAVKGTRKKSGMPAGLEFDLSKSAQGAGALLVHSMQLAAPKPGTYCKAKVYTRGNQEEQWKFCGVTTFFSVLQNGQITTNDPFFLGNRRVGQVRFEAASENSALPDDLAFSFSYIPYDVFFIAQGPGPYLLHWHGKRAIPSDRDGFFADLHSESQIPPVSLVQIRLSDAMPQEEPFWAGMGKEENSKTVLLWILLGGGVLLLAYMALQLNRSLKKEEKTQPPKDQPDA